MGSSKINQWERAGKLLASAMKLVLDGSRSVEAWADHLQVFVFSQFLKVLVNYDDPAYRRIDRDQYAFVDGSLRPEHFPVRGKGQTEVTYKYLEYDHEASNEEVLQDIARRCDVRLPDFAETMAFHKANPEERVKAPVISLCGSIESRGGERSVAFIDADDRGVDLGWGWLYKGWIQRCRFLVVCK